MAGGAGGYNDGQALIAQTPRGGGGGGGAARGGTGGKNRRVGTASSGATASARNGNVSTPQSAALHPYAGGLSGGLETGGHMAPQDSLDGRSSTTPDAGRGARTTGSRGSAGKATSRSGGAGAPSHFDTEMEANRLGYVRFLQV